MSKENKEKILDALGPFEQLKEMNSLLWLFNEDLKELMSFDTENDENNEEEIKVYARVVNELATMRSIIDQLTIMLDAEPILEEVMDEIEETISEQLLEDTGPVLIN